MATPTQAQIQQAQQLRNMGLGPQEVKTLQRLKLSEDIVPTQIERGEGGQIETGTHTNYGITTDLGNLRSKFNSVVPNDDGSFSVVFQQPGKHKYDTFEGVYQLDKDSGELVLQGGLRPTRQISSGERFRDGLEKGTAFVGSGLLAAYGGAQFAGLASAGSSAAAQTVGTAARAAATNAAITAAAGGDQSQITRAGLMGAITGAAGTGARLVSGFTGAAGQAVSGAASAATSTAIRGGTAEDALKSAIISAAPGVAGFSLNDNQALNPTTAQIVRTLTQSAVSGQAPQNRQALLVQLLTAMARQPRGTPK